MTNRQWQLGAVLGSLLVAACGGSNGVAVCSVDADCATGQTCSSGVCTLGAADSGTGTGGGIGAACSGTSCATGEVCLPASDGFVGGYCSEPCGSHVCPSGSACLDLTATPVGEKACAESCQFNSDCRTGYTCCPGYENTCVPTAFCAAHADGGSPVDGGHPSDAGTPDGGNEGDGGILADAGEPGDGGPGEDGGAPTDGGTLDGGSPTDGGPLDGGPLDGGAPTDGGTEDDGGIPLDGGTLACNGGSATLVNGGTVGPASAPACLFPVIGPALVEGETVQNRGRTQVGTSVEFFVDAGIGTISIIQQVWDAGAPLSVEFSDGGYLAPNNIAPITLTAPDGTSYFNFDTDALSAVSDNTAVEYYFGDFEPSTQAMTLPNSSQGLTHQTSGYPSGTWTLTVGDFSYLCAEPDQTLLGDIGDTSCSGRSDANTQYYDVRVVTKPIMGANGTVDIGLYLVSTQWTAATAITDPNWIRFVEDLQALYSNAGLCLGTVTFYDVPAWAKNLYATGITDQDTPPCGNLQQMLTLSNTNSALNYFFVDSISATGTSGIDSETGGTITSWLSGPIPGPAGVGGTEFSGVALEVSDIQAPGCTDSVDYVNCGSDALAYAAAHKGGHMMGLYHTSESTYDANMTAVFDPINDTPECDPNNCGSGGVVMATDCEDDSATTNVCGGGDYLMFWDTGTNSAGTISAQEGQIIRSSPVVKPAITSAREPSMNQLIAAISLALILASPLSASAAEKQTALSDEQVRSTVHAYLASIDTRIPLDRWQKLGSRGEAALLEIANGNGLPTRRSRAIENLARLGSTEAPALFSRIAGDETEPLAVRYAALRGLGRVLSPAKVLSSLQPILEGASDVRVRAMAGEQLTLRSPQLGCPLVHAQVGREPEAERANFDRARSACLGR